MNKSLRALYWVVFLDHLSINLCYPVMVFVFFSHRSRLFPLGASDVLRNHWYGYSLAVMSCVGILASPILGTLSDRLGRKAMLVFAAIGTALAGLFCAWGVMASMIGVFILGRLFWGVCTRTEPFALAAVSDVYPENDRIAPMGFIQSLIAVGAMFGPILGGYFSEFYFDRLNFSAPYIFAMLLGLLAAVLGFFGFKETHDGPHTYVVTPWKKMLQDRYTLFCAIILFGSQLSWSLYYQFIPVILKQTLFYSPTKIGYFISVLALWLSLMGAFGVKYLSNKFSESALLYVGMLSLLLGLSLTIFSWYWVGAFGIACGDILVYCVVITRLANRWNMSVGKIMGVGYSLVLATWAFTGLLGGFLLSFGVNIPLYLAPVPLLVLLSLLFIFKNPQNTPISA